MVPPSLDLGSTPWEDGPAQAKKNAYTYKWEEVAYIQARPNSRAQASIVLWPDMGLSVCLSAIHVPNYEINRVRLGLPIKYSVESELKRFLTMLSFFYHWSRPVPNNKHIKFLDPSPAWMLRTEVQNG